MKKTALSFILIFLVSTLSYAWDQKRYTIKSGIVEYKLSGMQEGTETLYFDQNGAREARHTDATSNFMGMKQKVQNVYYIDGDWAYSYDVKTNTAMKINMKEMMNDADAKNLKEYGEKILKEMGGEKTGSKNILGKQCEVWSIPKFGSTTCVYKNSIPLEYSAHFNGMDMNSVAINLQENASVPQDKLTLPKTAKITEMPNVAEMPNLKGVMNQLGTAQQEEASQTGASLSEREMALREKELELKQKELELQETQLQQNAGKSKDTGKLDKVSKTVDTTNKVRNTLSGLRGLLGR